jgi:hypothetical protein
MYVLIENMRKCGFRKFSSAGDTLLEALLAAVWLNQRKKEIQRSSLLRISQNLLMADQAENDAFLALEKAVKECAMNGDTATCSRNFASDGCTTKISVKHAKLAGK